MPKRIPTPPPGDDEPKYFSVVHPYAREGYCNMELQQDRKDFAFWVACCIDKGAFFAIFHKPSARDMVIIEVDRDYPHFDRLLGEHRWSEFLRKPSTEEKGRVTQVFYCTYNTGRNVEKKGWKRVFVEDAWFDDWSPNNSLITNPYPAPHFCEVPTEDATNHPLCRPLPGLPKPAPSEVIAAPKPVVGSAAWANSREVPAIRTTSAWNTPLVKGLTKQGVPKPAVPLTNINTKQSATSTQLRNPTVPAVGGGSFVVKASNVWRTDVKQGANPPTAVPVNWECSPGSSRQSTPEQQQSAASSSPTSIDQLTPRLSSKANTGKAVSDGNDHRGKTPSPASTPGSAPYVPDRATNWSDASSSSTGSSHLVSTPDAELGCNEVCEGPRMIHVQMSESFEEEFHGIGIRERGRISDEDEYEDLAELDAVAPGSCTTATNTWGTIDPQATGGWGDTAGSQQNTEKKLEKEVCSVHGVICRKGICAVQGKKQAAAKRIKKMEEAAKQQQEKANKKGKRPAANGGGGGPTTGTNAQNNPYRGAGAPVKKNWRGAPRAIVSPDALEQREAATQPVENVNGWGNNDNAADGSDEPTTQNTDIASDATSNDGWHVSEAGYDPWAPSAPAKKGMSWADEMEAVSAAGSDGERRSGIRGRRGQGKRRGGK